MKNWFLWIVKFCSHIFVFVLLSLLFFTFCSVTPFSPVLHLAFYVAVLSGVATFACFQFVFRCFRCSTRGAKKRIGCGGGGGGFFVICTAILNFVLASTLHPGQSLFCTDTSMLCSMCHPTMSLTCWIAVPHSVAFAADKFVVGCFGGIAIGTTKSGGVCGGSCFPF